MKSDNRVFHYVDDDGDHIDIYQNPPGTSPLDLMLEASKEGVFLTPSAQRDIIDVLEAHLDAIGEEDQ